jgi:RHS repeat-associated protein
VNIRTSILSTAVALLIATDRTEAVYSNGLTTTVYVGRHFEVRDQDQPVKYVFNGETRVARITGSLSANRRIQRLRLRTGWNLCGMAVSGASLPPNPQIIGVLRWNPATHAYIAVPAGETLDAGSVIWVKAGADATVSLVGDYVEPGPVSVSGGGTYVSGAGLETWTLPLPAGVTVWRFDAARRCWQPTFTGDLAPVAELPAKLAPGEAIYVHTEQPVELAVPEPELSIAYYHPDHLGSSSATTDGAGNVAEETAYYPFGAVRHQHRARDVDTHYGFTQKERDAESGLHYFEARYLVSSLARFLSFDPMIKGLEGLEEGELQKFVAQPAKLNPLVYALNNPMRYVDPDGRETRPRPQESKPKQPEAELTIRIGEPSKEPGELGALSLSVDSKDGAGGANGGGHGSGKASLPTFRITRESDKASHELFLKSHTGQGIKSVTLIMPSKQGGELRIYLQDVVVEAATVSTAAALGEPMATFTLNAASVRFGDADAPPPAREPLGLWRYNLRRGQ